MKILLGCNVFAASVLFGCGAQQGVTRSSSISSPVEDVPAEEHRDSLPWLEGSAAHALLQEPLQQCESWRNRTADTETCDSSESGGRAGVDFRAQLASLVEANAGPDGDGGWVRARKRTDQYELRILYGSGSRTTHTDYYRLLPGSCSFSGASVSEDDHYPVAHVSFGAADEDERTALLEVMDAERGDAARTDHARAFGLINTSHQFSNRSYECSALGGLCLGAPEPLEAPRAGRPNATARNTVWAGHFFIRGVHQPQSHPRANGRWETLHTDWSVAVYDALRDQHWWIPGGGEPVPDSPYERPMLLHVRRQLIDLRRGIVLYFNFSDPDCDFDMCEEDERAVLTPSELWRRLDTYEWNLQSDCDGR